MIATFAPVDMPCLVGFGAVGWAGLGGVAGPSVFASRLEDGSTGDSSEPRPADGAEADQARHVDGREGCDHRRGSRRRPGRSAGAVGKKEFYQPLRKSGIWEIDRFQ